MTRYLVAALLCLTATATAQESQPAIPHALSAERCIANADELLDRDEYAEARDWYEAARERTKNERLLQRVAFRLKTLPLYGERAVEPIVDEWLTERRPSLDRLAGRVVMLSFFQAIQPASMHANTALDELATRNADRGLACIGVAVVLDSPELQKPEDTKHDVAANRLSFPVARDAKLRRTFDLYSLDVSPSVVLIDRAGRVRWIDGFDGDTVQRKALKLLAETPDHRLPGVRKVVPASREGFGVVGRKAPRLRTKEWMNTPDGGPPEILGRPRLIRFWMSDCNYCKATTPALNALHRDYAGRGLTVIGVYHPKPVPRHVPFDQVRLAANRLEMSFPVTADNDWAYLRKIWLTGKPREFTSATFLIDAKGVIRYVHPGPDFFRSDDPAKARQNRDYLELRAAIEAVLSD